ncbi:DUF2513 domain-containing protein [Celeribacter sp. SCSIO 80788]|uniref:DUF2513 domain-containing protein n=1 Tax=Celeribacter sp. SCSIO 80788 TaxID=3117013 RepID=UPI003DA6B34F
MAARDLNRIRELLIHLEAIDAPDGWVWLRETDFLIENDAYQLILMEQAGFCELSAKTMNSQLPGLIRISFLGHDYLDAIRDEGVWIKTKKGLAAVGGGTLEIAKDMAVAYIKQEAAEKLGITL